jgi:hypothetical protein
MAKITFENNGKVIDVAKGKMQWNTSSADFRSAMQYRYDAAVKMADIRVQAQTDIKTIKGMIDFTMKQNYYSSTDIDKYNAQIDEIQKATSDADAEFKANAPAETDADKNLYYAYKAYVNDEEIPASGNTFQRAFYEWADFNGMKPTAETFNFISKKIGVKKLGAKAIVKANGEKFTGALSKTAFYTVFYAVIMECLKAQNLLKGYTFTCTFANELAKKAADKKSSK